MKTLYPHVFPMSCNCPDGATRIAKDHLQMSSFMGEPYGPDGELIVAPEPEPIVDEIGITMTPQCQFDAEPMQPVEEYLPPSGNSCTNLQPGAVAPPKNKGGRPRRVQE